ncbi:hypothetical protein L7F22_060979 [Adiantum nelumboides]|nr:hypothetical protein [Adiantum nelumboides]
MVDRLGQQTHEVGESSRPPQTDDDIFRTQLITDVTMFSQVMRNPRFLAFLQPLLPSQQVGSLDHIPKPDRLPTRVIKTANSIETPVHLSETMQSPKPMPNVQEQVAETLIFQAMPVQPVTFQQPIVGSKGQGSSLQAMQQVFPPPSVHHGYFGGGSVFQSMAGHAPGNQFYTPEWHQLNAASCKNIDDYNRKFWKALLPLIEAANTSNGLLKGEDCEFNTGVKEGSGKKNSTKKYFLKEAPKVTQEPAKAWKSKATAEPTKGPTKKWKRPFARKSKEQKQVLRSKNKCFICEQPGHIAPNCPQRKKPADSKDEEDRKEKKPMAGLVPDMVGDKPTSDASELCRAWGKVKNQTVHIFFDPSAKANFISPELASKLGIKSEEMGYTVEFAGRCIGMESPKLDVTDDVESMIWGLFQGACRTTYLT